MKKIIALLLFVTIVLTLSSCAKQKASNSGNIADVVEQVNSEYVDFEIVEENYWDGWCVVYDKNTKVMYVILDAYQSTGMTPIYNSDGTVKLYEE